VTALFTPSSVTAGETATLTLDAALDATTGNATVTITGTQFTGAGAVLFDGEAATSFTVNSDTQITAVTPAHAAGTVTITVTTPAGSAESASGFTYIETPRRRP
jgi:hypothetical protein